MGSRTGLAKKKRFSKMACLALGVITVLGASLSCAASTTPATTAAVSATTLVSATTTLSTTAAPQTTVASAPAMTPTSSTPLTLAPLDGGAPTSTVPVPPPAPLIVLDPGHSGTSLTTIDPATQIRDEEYRVNFANMNHAALGVSIHTSGHTFGHYGQIYVQRMDSYRENIHGKKVYFALPGVAALSAEYGQIFLEERRKIEGSSVVITVNTSWGARGLAPGNLPIVQLFSEVPWILNEAGVPQNEKDKDHYAQSLFNSIVKCVPIGA